VTARISRVYSAGLALLLLGASVLPAQKSESPLVNQLQALVTVSPAERPAATLRAATAIRELPAGVFKVQCADALAQISFRDDPGARALQAVRGTLNDALAGFAVDGSDGLPATAYLDLARLVRYEHAGAGLDDARFAEAMGMLAEADRKVQEADFTLNDLNGRSYTLSRLRGKVVLVNFWASWCGPCLVEMPDLDRLYEQLKSRGVVILAISNEREEKVRAAVSRMDFRAPVLLDPGAEVGHRFGLDGLPRTFVFNREGKLVAVGVDKRSRRQLLQMLGAAGIHP
jgi:peroxiredoxin